jgi:hypothetical protein
MTVELVEIGAIVVELGSTPPLHGIALREHHEIASPPWPLSHGILIFLSMRVSDAYAMRHLCAGCCALHGELEEIVAVFEEVD